MFLLEGSLGTGHPSSVEFIKPLPSHISTRSLEEPPDLGVHQKGTLHYLKFIQINNNEMMMMMMMMMMIYVAFPQRKW